MQSTIQLKNQPESPTRLPRPDGGGVSEADGGGLPESPSSPNPQSLMPTPSLSVPILESLLDPAMTPTLICQAHNLTLQELQAITESAAYKQAAAAIESINATRQSTINSNLKTQSLAALRDIVNDSTLAAQDNPKRAATFQETARKATTTLLKHTITPATPAPSFSSPGLAGEVSSAARRRGSSPSPLPFPSSHHNLAADFTGDGLLNFYDISRFLHAFADGCP